MVQKFTEEDMKRICEAYSSQESTAAELAKSHGVPVRRIYRILHDNNCEVGQKPEDLVGESFGWLTVEKLIKRQFGHGSIWSCRCKCGREVRRRSYSLKSGSYLRCPKCFPGLVLEEQFKMEVLSRYPNNRNTANNCIVGDIIHCCWNRLLYNAQVRGIAFDLTPTQVWDQFLLQDRKCWYTGEELVFAKRSRDMYSELHTASLDRTNSHKPYQPDNVRWIHKKIQRVKHNLIDTEFLEICRRITAHHPENALKV